jgi:hypothetical protein
VPRGVAFRCRQQLTDRAVGAPPRANRRYIESMLLPERQEQEEEGGMMMAENTPPAST